MQAPHALLLYRLEPGVALDEAGLAFDGELLALRRAPDGALLTLHAEQLLHLALDGLRVAAQTPITALTLVDGELRIRASGAVSVDAPALRVFVNDAPR